jgi:hypothetical protein
MFGFLQIKRLFSANQAELSQKFNFLFSGLTDLEILYMWVCFNLKAKIFAF